MKAFAPTRQPAKRYSEEASSAFMHQWLRQKFYNASIPKVFLELGAHNGGDTVALASIPNTIVHAFEPDPRNLSVLALIENPHIFMHACAVSNHNGTAKFILSERGWGQEWTYSNSLKAPKNHLKRFPQVKFGETIYVRTVTLDSACEGIPLIDFIWCDIQGAEGDMIRGAQAVLKRTRYLYTEYSDHEMYEGQPTLQQLSELLGRDWEIEERFPDDVLFANRNYVQ